jgi:proline iminopeptidase
MGTCVSTLMCVFDACSRRCVRRFYQGPGASFVYPDAWDKYLAPIPEAERGDLVAAYYKRALLFW